MKSLTFILIFFANLIFAQRIYFADSLRMSAVRDFLVDDYGNIYISQNKDFSFTKFDSLGNMRGRMMLAVPYKIQSVQNPLNIPMFSENAQELKFVDQKLNEIRKFPLRDFGFINMAFVDGQQQAWLLDGSTKRLIRYSFTENAVKATVPFNIDFEDVKDLLVFENLVYILSKSNFSVFDLNNKKIYSSPVENPVRLRRENSTVFVISKKEISRYDVGSALKKVFSAPEAQIVDKNASAFFELKGGKIYLYSPEKIMDKN